MRQFILEAFIILLLSLVPLFWFGSPTMLLGHDTGMRLEGLGHLSELFYSWNPRLNFGADNSLYKGSLLIKIPELLLISAFGFSLGQRLSFVFWFFVIGISMLISMSLFFSTRAHWPLRLSTSIFWMYNMFILQGWSIAERAKFSLWAALPLSFVLLFKTLNRDMSLKTSAFYFWLLFFFLNGGGSIPLYGGIGICLFLIGCYFIIQALYAKDIPSVWFTIKTFVTFIAGALALNAYWVIPQLYLATHTYGVALDSMGGLDSISDWVDVISKDASFFHLVRLQGLPGWYETYIHPYASLYLSQPLLKIASIVPFCILVVGCAYACISKKTIGGKKLLIIFLAVTFFGYIFTAGSHPPFGFLFSWFIQTVPGFAIFRTPFYKFGPAYWFGFIILFGISLQLLIQKFRSKTIRIFLGVSAIIFLLVYHFPYFTGNIYTRDEPFSTKVTVPDYVIQTSDYLKQVSSETDRIMLFPPHTNDLFKADAYTWGYWGLTALLRYRLNRSIIANDRFSPAFVDTMYADVDVGNEADFVKKVAQSGIRYIIWRDDTLSTDKAIGPSAHYAMLARLQSFSSMVRLRTFGAWSVYEIHDSHVSPIITATDSDTSNNPDVKITRINPTLYKAIISRSPNSIMLQFGERYSPNWVAWIQTHGQSRPVNDILHTPSETDTNVWYIDAPSKQYSIHISYRPQYYFYIGCIISSVSLLGVIVLIVKRQFGWRRG